MWLWIIGGVLVFIVVVGILLVLGYYLLLKSIFG